MTEPALHVSATDAARPLTLVLNHTSREGKQEKLEERINESLRVSGRAFRIVSASPDSKEVQAAVTRAAKENGIVVAAGGDGTVGAIAALCYAQDVPLGILPLGTFNYFAREMGIPTALDQAIEVLLSGELREASVGFVNDRLFLNNASFGLYTKLIRKREEATSRFGRIRIIAALSAIVSLLRGSRMFTVRLNVDGKDMLHHTSLVFVGNNTLQLENLGLKAAEFTRADTLAVIVMKRTTRYETLRIMLRSLTRSLKDESQLEEFTGEDLVVETKRRHIDLVIDGEIVRSEAPLSFRIEHAALRVLAPKPEAA